MSRRAYASSAVTIEDPVPALNVTPLIDVLLVLIVMLILTIPIMTHKVPIDLPAPGPRTVAPTTYHRISIAPSGAPRGATRGRPAAAAASR